MGVPIPRQHDYDAKQTTDLKIPAFEKDYRYIKTIALSVFNTRERTSWHFGPLRLTFRVLYNLDPIDSRDVYIEVDDKVHYWIDNPLFIYLHRAFDVAVQVASAVSGAFKRVFYKNWSFVR